MKILLHPDTKEALNMHIVRFLMHRYIISRRELFTTNKYYLILLPVITPRFYSLFLLPIFTTRFYYPFLLPILDRKSTRLNSSHVAISYAVFCLKKTKSIYIYLIVKGFRLNLSIITNFTYYSLLTLYIHQPV